MDRWRLGEEEEGGEGRAFYDGGGGKGVGKCMLSCEVSDIHSFNDVMQSSIRQVVNATAMCTHFPKFPCACCIFSPVGTEPIL